MPVLLNTPNTKIYPSNFEYNLSNKHVEYSDKHMGAVHPGLSNMDFQLMKICTIILIGIMKLDLITVAGFFIIHFIYWEFIGKTSASDLLKDIEISDLKLSIKALTETKKKKLENK